MNKYIAAAVLGLLIPQISLAQEINFSAPNAEDGLSDILRDASLLLSIDPEETSGAQDYVAAARADYRRILTALYADGYYGGEVSIRIDGREAAAIAPLEAPRQIGTIDINVAPGPRFTFGQTQIAPLPPATELPDGFRGGEPAQSEVIREAVATGIRSWREAGYAKAATADQEIIARHTVSQLDAAVTIAPGPQLTFGNLIVTGNQAVRTDAILRIAGLPKGEVFTPEEVERAAQRLRRTGAFDSAALTEAENIGPNNTLPINAQIVESKPRRIGFGLELSSIDGLTVSSYWLHRNFLGGAERFRVEGEVSGIGGETGGTDYKLGFNFNRPAIVGADTDLFIKSRISREDEPTYLLDQFSFEIGLTRLFTDDLTLSYGVGLLAAHEETDIDERDYVLLTIPLSAELDLRDNAANAKNGYYIDIDATPFISLTGGDHGGRVYADARAYRSFGDNDRFTIAARTQIGSVVGASIENAPADFLFYSGGGGTVRGQPYKSLGVVTDLTGGTLRSGGLGFAGAQLEARVDVTESIGVVGFYDFGYVSPDANPFENGNWHSGTGIGVRYNTGIGPIRLDLGTPANGDNAFDELQVYIGIGQAF